MKKYLLVLVMLNLGQQLVRAQNILPNGDFENYSAFPSGVGEWFKCNGWSNVNGVTVVAFPYASPDYLHINGTGQVDLPNSTLATVSPYSGNAIMGFVTKHLSESDYREYLAIQLSTALVIGDSYTVSFWITNGSSNHIAGYSSNHIGVRFSSSPLSQVDHEPIGGTPQLEIPGEVWATSWQAVSFQFTADAAYNYFTIGNFYDDAATSATFHVSSTITASYYFIDKIEIIPSNNCQTLFSISASQNDDTLYATTAPNYQWYFNDTLIPGAIDQNYLINEGGYYYVVSTTDSCTYTSNIIETSCLCVGINENDFSKKISLYPNPATTTLTIETDLRGAKYEVRIMNAIGQIAFQSYIVPRKSSIDISNLSPGLYYLSLQSDEGVATKKFEVIR